ncbi:MAG: hypothetical protein INR69_16990, partial [Mucilaginibacter polytrichastri]|nr:hypothetical protein [Mucilaginibacter polytrichastri]
ISLAGDLIRETLALYAGEINAGDENGGVHMDEPVSPLKIQRRLEKGWAFPYYPVSARLDKALSGDPVFSQLDLLSGNIARRRGVILHDVLARAVSADDVEPVLRSMQQNGLFRAHEYDELLRLSKNVFQQPELAALLAKPYKTVNEQTIINKDGKSYRPDKVLLGENETIIIDFKFTDEPKPAHDKQIANYQILLGEIGYTPIRSYLYYGLLNQLKEVSL